MTPDEYAAKYVGVTTPTVTETTPVAPAVKPPTQTDVKTDVRDSVRNSARVAPTASDYQATPSSYYAKYVMPTTEEPQTGPKPIDVTTSEMIQNKDKGQYNGFCQRFVEDATYGHHGIFDSAISAWNKLPNKVQGLTGIKPGDLVYFSANAGNNNDGHVGIYEGNGTFKSATSNGIEDQNIGDWMHKTGQQVLGYVPV